MKKSLLIQSLLAVALAGRFKPSDGDWPEDAAHENGNYQCQCCECGKVFIGHKRRVVCKACANRATDQGGGSPARST